MTAAEIVTLTDRADAVRSALLTAGLTVVAVASARPQAGYVTLYVHPR